MPAIPAIRVKQWLPDWDQYTFDPSQLRSRPSPYIYLFSMSAVQLRSLSGVYRRRHDGESADGLQRFHDEKRSKLIRDFVRFGYPYSSIKPELRTDSNLSLRKPGWLPTAIVVNILEPKDKRRGRQVAATEFVKVHNIKYNLAELSLPYDDPSEKWSPKSLEPIEVIDGQHRLWAFDEAIRDGSISSDFELPVVAFVGLELGWQAYLFWSINVSPVRINPSHAFDLYPLLRSQDWLETQSDLRIYREARAQELTELMYLHPLSPWYLRINMLGGSGENAPLTAGVTQAGWVRALTSTFLSPGARGRAAKGLFAAPIGGNPLDWPRSQQSALLIELWSKLKESIVETDPRWARALRVREKGQSLERTGRRDPFAGTRTILNQEQGIRGVLAVSNEILFAEAEENSKLFNWELDQDIGTSTSVDDVSLAISNLRRRNLSKYLSELAATLAEFDWRTAEAPNLSERQRLLRRAYRGSGGYVALRQQLLKHVAGYECPAGERAAEILESRS